MAYTPKGDPSELGKPILGEDNNGVINFFVRDTFTNSIGSINSVHLKGHQGKSFYTDYINTSVANGGTVDLLLNNPASNYPHFVAYIKTSGNASIDFYKGTTASANGTALTSQNRNDNSSNVAGLVVSHTPTVTTLGTLKHQGYSIGGEHNKLTGGENGFSEEIILTPNTKYLMRVTNTAGVASIIVIHTHWYE
jgi:hypothetical protein